MTPKTPTSPGFLWTQGQRSNNDRSRRMSRMSLTSLKSPASVYSRQSSVVIDFSKWDIMFANLQKNVEIEFGDKEN